MTDRNASLGEAEKRANKIMTREEYNALNLQGWHQVCHDSDGTTSICYGLPSFKDGIEAAAKVAEERSAREKALQVACIRTAQPEKSSEYCYGRVVADNIASAIRALSSKGGAGRDSPHEA